MTSHTKKQNAKLKNVLKSKLGVIPNP